MGGGKLVLPVVRSVAADWANGDVSPEQMPTRLGWPDAKSPA